MKVVRVNRTKFNIDFLFRMWFPSKKCQDIPTMYYNQQHCIMAKKMMKFEQQFKCNILSIFRTHDLNMSFPMCNGQKIHKMTSFISKIGNVDTCPVACIEEKIEMMNSFTIQSDETFEKTRKAWNMPEYLDKEDSVVMDIYFTSLTSDVGLPQLGVILLIMMLQVTVLEPQTMTDLLSSVGGSLGIYLGGSIFSLIEILIIASLFTLSITGYVFSNTKQYFI